MQQNATWPNFNQSCHRKITESILYNNRSIPIFRRWEQWMVILSDLLYYKDCKVGLSDFLFDSLEVGQEFGTIRQYLKSE